MKLTEEQILQISKGDLEIAAFITTLLERIDHLTHRVQELERQVGQNSQNSSKPPSSDGFRKPTKNQRQSGGKKGAPIGHQGHTLQMTNVPDEVVMQSAHTCSFCRHALEDVVSDSFERRQVFDLPFQRLHVTEYRAERKCCPQCLQYTKAAFPANVAAPVQYGERFGAWAVYLTQYQLLPLERVCQFFTDLVGQSPSEATLLRYIQVYGQAFIPAEHVIRQRLLQSDLLHADETGISVEGKPHWVHTVSNQQWTLLSVHKSRGLEAVKENGMLPVFQGRVMHDSLSMYFHDKFSFKHALCGAHLLRECQGIIDNDGHLWATDMKQLLQEAWKHAQAARVRHQALDAPVLADLEQRYDDILREGAQEWGPPKRSKLKKGAFKKTKAANLGERFLTYKPYILGFLRDARIPFDNNQAERDLRMIKVKQKISGTIRTSQGAKIFMRIRSVLASLRKQSRPIFESLLQARRGEFTF